MNECFTYENIMTEVKINSIIKFFLLFSIKIIKIQLLSNKGSYIVFDISFVHNQLSKLIITLFFLLLFLNIEQTDELT